MNQWRIRERGQGIVEFAVIFPVLIVFVFMMIDGGILMGRYNQINHAAQEGGRIAATGADTQAIVERVQAQANGVLDDVPPDGRCFGQNQICVERVRGPDIDGQPRQAAGEVGSYVKVTVRYRYDLLTPLNGFGLQDFDVSACALARLERPTRASGGGAPQC